MNPYDQVHAKRFELSLARIQYNVPAGSRILELGGGGKFTEMLRATGYDVVVPTGDFRYRHFHDSQDAATFDLVACMEVIEHIHDQDSTGVPTEWAGTGTDCMLAECRAFLKPDGWLFLTTPNADSLNVVNKVIRRQGPMVYRPHVREYTVYELVELARKANFDVTHVETHECWDNSMDARSRVAVTKLITELMGAKGLEHRGEDIFLWAKPRVSR